MPGIYCIRNIKNEKVYIGQTNGNMNKAIQIRKYNLKAKKCNRRLKNELEKYEINDFTILAVEECPIELLDEKEKYWISYYQSDNPEFGYNIQPGGRKSTHPKEVREIIANSRRGTHLKDSTKLKIGLKHKGKFLTEKQRKHLSKINMGKSYPKRAKQKPEKEIIREDISERNSGLGNGRVKLTLEQCKEIKTLLNSGKGIKEVAEMFNISTYPIGKIKHGTHWSCKT